MTTCDCLRKAAEVCRHISEESSCQRAAEAILALDCKHSIQYPDNATTEMIRFSDALKTLEARYAALKAHAEAMAKDLRENGYCMPDESAGLVSYETAKQRGEV